MKDKFFYFIEVDNEILTKISPTLANVSLGQFTSEVFDTGQEAMIYLDHIAKTLPTTSTVERTENPEYFGLQALEDYLEPWENNIAVRLRIENDEHKLVFKGQLMVNTLADEPPKISQHLH